MKQVKRNSEFKEQLKRRALESKEKAPYVRPLKAKKDKDPRFFDVDQYGGEMVFKDIERKKGPGMPQGEIPSIIQKFRAEQAAILGKAFAFALLCLFTFPADAQNAVTAQDVSKRWVEFTWYGDTLTNSNLRPFIESSGYADTTAIRVSTEVTALLMLTRDVTNASIYMGNVLQGMTFEQYCRFYLGLKEDGR